MSLILFLMIVAAVMLMLGCMAQLFIWISRGMEQIKEKGRQFKVFLDDVPPYKVILLAFLLLAGSAHASTVNPSSQFIPSDPALAFVALGGGIAGGVDLICDYAHTPRWERSLIEVLGSVYLCYIAQRMTGSDPAVPNSLNRALWGCVGASGVWTISWGAGQ